MNITEVNLQAIELIIKEKEQLKEENIKLKEDIFEYKVREQRLIKILNETDDLT